MLNFNKLFSATTTLNRDNHFTINIPAGCLEHKTFTALIKVLVKDGKLLNSPVRGTCVIEFNETESMFIISAATDKRGAIYIKAPVTDGAIDPLNVTVGTDEGNLNLMKAVFQSPLIMTQLNVLLPGMIAACWKAYACLEAGAISNESRDARITALRAERDVVLEAIGTGQPNAREVIRTNYRNQIAAIEKS